MLRSALLLMAFAITSLSYSQTLELANKTISDANSKNLYVGVDNVFEINGVTVNSVVPQEGVSLNMNKLVIRPNMPGSFAVTLVTPNGKETINFNVKTVPEVTAVINGQTTVMKDAPFQGNLSLKSLDFSDSYYSNYNIIAYTASLNGNSFQVNGNSFSKELNSAIAGSKAGDLLVISSMKAYNAELNKTIDLKGNFSLNIQ